MTFREKLVKDHPELVSDICVGGCFMCPSTYKYEKHKPVTCTPSKETCTDCWDRPMVNDVPTTEPNVPIEPKEDVVNHPNHYTNGGMECIDEMILIFGKEAVAHFCLCNAWKYRYRALYKNKEEDMQKSHWYINKYKELMNEWNSVIPQGSLKIGR